MLIQTDNLTKVYKNVVAVKNVNMHIEEGDVYGFVGENGAGKTTIIRLLSGLAEPTSGSYSINGVDFKDPKILAERGKMGCIVESVTVVKGMTALENLQLERTITGASKTDSELIQIIDKVGLDYEAIKNRKAGNFSLGMRQRLGIATTLVSDPSIIILDEPMNGLDPQGFVEIRETIQRLSSEGITFLISSHILSELDKICNKVGFISHGELIEEISMDDLHKQSRKHILIVSQDNEKMESAIRTLSLKEVEVSENVYKIYDETDLNDVLKALVENNVKIASINVKYDTVENHYFSLIQRRNTK